jgi:glycosyltransferase involved in cell wall biosynthesis
LKILIIKESRSESGIEGVATYVLTVCRQFREAGVDHVVVHNRENRFSEQLRSEGTTVLMRDLPPNSWANYRHPMRLLRMRREITKIIEEGDFTHVWIHFSGLLPLITKRVKKNGVKIVVHQHAAMPEESKLTVFERKNFTNPKRFLAAAYRKYVLFNFDKADIVISLTNDGKLTSMNTYGVAEHKIRIVPHGTDFGEEPFDFKALVDSKIAAKQKTIISVGRETVGKGVVDFCELATRFSDRDDVKFMFIGGGTDKGPGADHEFREQLHEKYSEHVDFLGVKFPVTSYFKQAHAMVFLTHREGQGIVLGEAAQFGVPSVTWDAVGVRDVMREEGLGPIVDFQDFDGLVKQVEKLLDNDKYYAELSEHIFSIRSNFAAKKNFERMMVNFNEV